VDIPSRDRIIHIIEDTFNITFSTLEKDDRRRLIDRAEEIGDLIEKVQSMMKTLKKE